MRFTATSMRSKSIFFLLPQTNLSWRLDNFFPAASIPKQIGFHKIDAGTNLLEASLLQCLSPSPISPNMPQMQPDRPLASETPQGPSPTPTKDHARPPAHTTRSRPPTHSQTQPRPLPAISSPGIAPSQCCFLNLRAMVTMTSRC